MPLIVLRSSFVFRPASASVVRNRGRVLVFTAGSPGTKTELSRDADWTGKVLTASDEGERGFTSFTSSTKELSDSLTEDQRLDVHPELTIPQLEMFLDES